MAQIQITDKEIAEMNQIAVSDEGMQDLLSQLKTYYLLKRPAPITSRHGATYTQGARNVNTRYMIPSDVSEITLSFMSPTNQTLSAYSGSTLIYTCNVITGAAWTINIPVMADDTFLFKGDPGTTIIYWWEH